MFMLKEMALIQPQQYQQPQKRQQQQNYTLEAHYDDDTVTIGNDMLPEVGIKSTMSSSERTNEQLFCTNEHPFDDAVNRFDISITSSCQSKESSTCFVQQLTSSTNLKNDCKRMTNTSQRRISYSFTALSSSSLVNHSLRQKVVVVGRKRISSYSIMFIICIVTTVLPSFSYGQPQPILSTKSTLSSSISKGRGSSSSSNKQQQQPAFYFGAQQPRHCYHNEHIREMLVGGVGQHILPRTTFLTPTSRLQRHQKEHFLNHCDQTLAYIYKVIMSQRGGGGGSGGDNKNNPNYQSSSQYYNDDNRYPSSPPSSSSGQDPYYDDYYGDDDYYDNKNNNKKQPSSSSNLFSSFTNSGSSSSSTNVVTNMFNKIKHGDRTIGIGCIGAGTLITMFGISLFFNRTLMRFGNLLMIAGVPILLGPSTTLSYFLQPTKIRATSCIVLGILLVFMGNPLFGIIFEVFGLLNLFGNMVPMVVFFLKQMPLFKTIFASTSSSSSISSNSNKSTQTPKNRRTSPYEDDDNYYYDDFDKNNNNNNYNNNQQDNDPYYYDPSGPSNQQQQQDQYYDNNYYR